MLTTTTTAMVKLANEYLQNPKFASDHLHKMQRSFSLTLSVMRLAERFIDSTLRSRSRLPEHLDSQFTSPRINCLRMSKPRFPRNASRVRRRFPRKTRFSSEVLTWQAGTTSFDGIFGSLRGRGRYVLLKSTVGFLCSSLHRTSWCTIFHLNLDRTTSCLSSSAIMFSSWISLVLLLVDLAKSRPADSPIVDLGYAQYQGSFDAANNQTNFLSIRYAAPPLGTLCAPFSRLTANDDAS